MSACCPQALLLPKQGPTAPDPTAALEPRERPEPHAVALSLLPSPGPSLAHPGDIQEATRRGLTGAGWCSERVSRWPGSHSRFSRTCLHPPPHPGVTVSGTALRPLRRPQHRYTEPAPSPAEPSPPTLRLSSPAQAHCSPHTGPKGMPDPAPTPVSPPCLSRIRDGRWGVGSGEQTTSLIH